MKWLILPKASALGLTSKPSRFIIREIDLGDFDLNTSACFCGSGRHYKNCHSEVRENSTLSSLFEAFRIIDEDVKSASLAPECELGCSVCCGDVFEVSFPEYLAILIHLQKKHSGFFSYRIRKIEEAAHSYTKTYDELKAFHGNISGMRLTMPCIFLDNRSENCRIYEVRPLLCRFYGYYSSAGDCVSAKNQLAFLPNHVQEISSKLLGDTIDGNKIFEPLAQPLVYWFGQSPFYKSDKFKKLFVTTNEKGIDEYVHMTIHEDFSEWFSI